MMTTDDTDSRAEDRREKVTVRQNGAFEHQERTVENIVAERQLVTDRLISFIYLVFTILESLIGLRVLLKMFPANPANLFAHFTYQLTDLFLWPFSGLVINPATDGRVLEITSLIGMLVLGLVGWGFVQVVRLVLFQTRTRTTIIYDKKRQ